CRLGGAEAAAGTRSPDIRFRRSRGIIMNPCPGREQLERLLSEQLNDAERVMVATHVEACSACQQHLHELAGDTTDDRRSLFPPPEASRLGPDLLRRMEQALGERAVVAAPAAVPSCTEARGSRVGPY